MASIFGGAGLREDAERVEAMRLKYGARQGSLMSAAGQLLGKFGYGSSSIDRLAQVSL
jgi:hypothetical protein